MERNSKKIRKVTVKFEDGQKIVYTKDPAKPGEFPTALFLDEKSVKEILIPYYKTIKNPKILNERILKKRFGIHRTEEAKKQASPSRAVAADVPITAEVVEKLWDTTDPDHEFEQIPLLAKLPECDVK